MPEGALPPPNRRKPEEFREKPTGSWSWVLAGVVAVLLDVSETSGYPK